MESITLRVCVFVMLVPHWTNGWLIALHSHIHSVPSHKAGLCLHECQNIQRIHGRNFSLQAKHIPKPSHGETEIKMEVEIEAALQTILDDLSSIPSHRRTSKITSSTQTDTDYRSPTRMKRLVNALRKSPALVQAILHNSNHDDDNDDDDYERKNKRGVMSLPQLVSLVGPMHKARLVDMLCRHPDLFCRVLTSPSIRVSQSVS